MQKKTVILCCQNCYDCLDVFRMTLLLKTDIFLSYSFNQDRIEALKYFFGLLCGIDEMSGIPEENMNYVQDMYTLLSSKTPDEECSALTHLKTTLYQVFFSYLQLIC